MTKHQIEQTLNAARVVATAAINVVATQYRFTTLIPFCREHRLTFHQDGGDYWFETETGERADSADWFQDWDRMDVYDAGHDIFNALALETLDETPLGLCIANVTVADWLPPVRREAVLHLVETKDDVHA